MKTKSTIPCVLLALLLFTPAARSQTLTWQSSSHWMLYNTRGAKWYKITIDSLASLKSHSLDDDSMRVFLKEAEPMAEDKPPLWMGAFVTTCIVDNKERKIDISSYGGFLFDELEKKYYTIPQQHQKDWLNYLAESSGAMSQQK